MPLLYLSGFWILGVFVASQLSLPGPWWWGLGGGGLLLGLLGWWRPARGGWWMVGAALLLLSGGALRYQARLPQSQPDRLLFYNDSGPLELRGVVVAEPELRERTVQLRVWVRETVVDGEPRPVQGLALVRAPLFSPYRYGDELLLVGRPQMPGLLGDFDYGRYLYYQGIETVLDHPKIERSGSGQGLQPLGGILALRERLAAALSRALPEPQAALAQGILLGIRSAMPRSLEEAFARSGTTHIIAISGYNIAVVAGIVLSLALRLGGQRWALLATLSAIIVYTVLTGMAPPVLRAAIMGALALLASSLGRQAEAGLGLVLAATLLTAVDPFFLWDVSFQLSFAATAGLIYLTPLFGQLRRHQAAAAGRPEPRAGPIQVIWDGFAVTLGAIVATLPLVAFTFHRVSLIAPAANLFAVPALPPILVTSAFVSLGGALWEPLGRVLAWVAWLPLTYLVRVVEAFGAAPLASLPVASFSELWVWGYYLLLLSGVWMVHRGPGWAGLRQRIASLTGSLGAFSLSLPFRWIFMPLLGLTAVVWLFVLTLPEARLRVSFLDVGQGDAILVQTPTRRQLLIDGGPSPRTVALRLGERLPFWERNLDLVVLTHPQADHLTGLLEVLKRYSVRQILESGRRSPARGYQEWLHLVEQRDALPLRAQRGQVAQLGGGVSLAVLHPRQPLADGSGNLNEDSVVLRLWLGEVSFLLTGDVQEEGQRRLLDEDLEVTSTLLKLPHHGGRAATFPQLLQRVKPAVAVISVGRDNPFGHPAPETLSALKAIIVFRTDERGTIEAQTDGQRLWVRAER